MFWLLPCWMMLALSAPPVLLFRESRAIKSLVGQVVLFVSDSNMVPTTKQPTEWNATCKPETSRIHFLRFELFSSASATAHVQCRAFQRRHTLAERENRVSNFCG